MDEIVFPFHVCDGNSGSTSTENTPYHPIRSDGAIPSRNMIRNNNVPDPPPDIPEGGPQCALLSPLPDVSVAAALRLGDYAIVHIDSASVASFLCLGDSPEVVERIYYFAKIVVPDPDCGHTDGQFCFLYQVQNAELTTDGTGYYNAMLIAAAGSPIPGGGTYFYPLFMTRDRPVVVDVECSASGQLDITWSP